MYRNIANIDALRPNAAIEAPANAGFRNNVKSNIARCPARRSTRTNATSSTTDATRNPTIMVLPQPSALPRTSAKIRRNRPPLNVTSPGTSTGCADGERNSSTLARATATPAIPIGTLTKKIDCQLICSVSTPPTSGPMATAAPMVAPQMPNAVPRSGPLNALAMSDSEVANIAAPPTPWRPRAKIRSVDDGEMPQRMEALVNPTRP